MLCCALHARAGGSRQVGVNSVSGVQMLMAHQAHAETKELTWPLIMMRISGLGGVGLSTTKSMSCRPRSAATYRTGEMQGRSAQQENRSQPTASNPMACGFLFALQYGHWQA